jgi:hypothetical protein
MSPTHTYTIPDYEHPKQAWCAICGGLIYFIKTHPRITVPIILIMLALMFGVVYDFVQAKKAQIYDAVPIGQTMEASFSIMPEAYAETNYTCKDSINIKGKFYGCWDRSVELYVVQGTSQAIVYDKKLGRVFKADIKELEWLNETRMKSLK